MAKKIAVSIRCADNGFIAIFNGEQLYTEGLECVGLDAGEIRDAVLAEFTNRLDATMTSLATLRAPDKDPADDPSR